MGMMKTIVGRVWKNDRMYLNIQFPEPVYSDGKCTLSLGGPAQLELAKLVMNTKKRVEFRAAYYGWIGTRYQDGERAMIRLRSACGKLASEWPVERLRETMCFDENKIWDYTDTVIED